MFIEIASKLFIKRSILTLCHANVQYATQQNVFLDKIKVF